MTSTRRSGILLHPTSFPGRFGIGDLGPAAYEFVDFLHAAGQQLWQVMPLGPTGYGDSPYQAFSAFAGNPLLVSPDALLQAGLLHGNDLTNLPDFPHDRVDYGWVIPWKTDLLRRAFGRFNELGTPEQRSAFAAFRAAHVSWLDDYALFAACKAAHGGAAWNTWDGPIARHEPTAVTEWRNKLADEIAFVSFGQWLFFSQWLDLKRYANSKGISVMGDIPIFVAFDSSDAWGNREIFAIDAAGNPEVVAGVPPDYFSETGQLWGNPHYRWDVLEAHHYDWWVERFRSTFALYDIARIDHFRGFEAYWEVPASEPTAINGRWVPGPNVKLFHAVTAALGDLPIVAEDLGVITPGMEQMRDSLGYPGMKVLQFAFGGDPADPFLPHNYVRHCVVYSGTHDNDTTQGWFASAPEHEQRLAQAYLGRDGSDIAWDLIRAALASVADTAIVPLQDVLNLGTEARMNLPGRASGNWGWRFFTGQLTPQHIDGLRRLVEIYGRLTSEGNSNTTK